MANKPKVDVARASFERQLESSLKLYAAVGPFVTHSYESIHEAPLHAAQARKIVGLCFMHIMSAWEEFVEGTFLRYLAGAKSGSYAPRLRLGACSNIRHAYQILSGRSDYDPSRQYMNWTKWSDVNALAKLYFVDGRPYSTLTQPFTQRIDDGSKIRNRVAHASEKCRKDFVKVATELLGNKGKLKQGFKVGDLLLTPAKGFGSQCPGGSTFFEAYVWMFEKMASVIAP